MIIISMFVGALWIVSLDAAAQEATPIVRSGKSCPTGYYKSGSYCKPISKKTKPAVEKKGDKCPTGTYKNNEYCKSI